MSIRSEIASRVAANAPPGTNAGVRTRQLIHTLISRFYPRQAPIDVSSLSVCAWEDAEEWVYLGSAHSMMISGQVTPLRYGQHIGAMVAGEIRAAGMHVVPIRAPGELQNLSQDSSIPTGKLRARRIT